MKKLSIVALLILLVVMACGAQPTSEPAVVQSTRPEPSPTQVQPTDTVPPPETPVPDQPTDTPSPPASQAEAVDHPGLPLPAERGDFFSASGACAVCHTQMEDESGNDVSNDVLWRASMMANAARDPYWQAAVRGETISNPDYQAVIEGKCVICHMGMARFTAVVGSEDAAVLDNGFSDPEHPLHTLAMDGTSCTLCHQFRDEGLGEPESFSGGYVIDGEVPAGERDSFGPHPVGEGLVQIMQGSSGFIPVESQHVNSSEVCATCHTLYTPYVDAAGEIVGEFPEQMPYAEWSASSFGGSIPCQSCHMPPAKGGVQLSITGGPKRSPVHQHIFVGGNVFMLDILRTFGEELEVTASSAQFESKMDQVAEQLQKRTASLTLKEVVVDGSSLTAEVAIATSTGHKFPTGFPSRRTWVHFVIYDAAGQVVFESGAVEVNGSIVGNDNDADPAAYEPHHLVIDNPEQVQIYETIMGDTEGEVTTVLLRGAEYLKDNRLLPPGFDKSAVDDDIAVYGAALNDDDFGGGGDLVRYTIDVGDAKGPFEVTAELLYQTVSYRWANNLGAYDAPEPERFLTYYEQISNQPVVVAIDSAEIAP